MLFEEYVAEHGTALLRLACALTRDPQLAEDLVQSALTDAYRAWPAVTAAAHPDAYVRRIVVNRHLATARKRRVRELLTAVLPDSAGSGTDAGDDVAGRDAFARAVDGLPPRSRAVLVLRYFADLDDAAIADALGIAPVTVRATASRALATLRRRFDSPDRLVREDS